MKKIQHQIFHSICILSAFFLLNGCVAPQPIQRTATFNESEYTPYGIPGNSTITGQAFLKTRAGDVKFGAGNIVILNPVTTYSTEWYEAATRGQKLTAGNERARKYHWETIADGNGNFKFSNLPAGEYYLMCQIVWEVPSEYGLVPSGGIALARVKAAPGEEVKVVLTR